MPKTEPNSVDESAPGIFTGEIKVASRIIDYLSSGLYKSPAACLKELINNAYDADASLVRVFVKPDAERIIVEDDGTGMSKDDFIRHFDRISESHKRDSSDVTAKYKRHKIGKIGIGFIAANELCEFMEIYSTKSGSTELLHVTINFSEMSKPISERRRDGDIAKADYQGEVLECGKDEHYTHIFLEAVRGEAQGLLVGARSQLSETHARSLYGKSAASVSELLSDGSLKSWKDFDFYSEAMLHVALNVPVKYSEKWLPSKLPSRLAAMAREVEDLQFSVFYDGTELRKPVVFSPQGKPYFIEPFEFKGKHVSAKGYFYAQHGTIKPPELHGLLVRIRNSAVGEYDQTFWDFSPTIAQLIQRWISVEIWADDQLEEAMNIDRRTLREAHPAYVELRDAIHMQLRKVIEKARVELYVKGSDERNKTKSADAKRGISQALSANRSVVRPNTVQQVETTWIKKSKSASGQKALLRKYSVAELYEIVLEIGQDILEPKQLQELLRRLTDRLSK